MAIGNTPLARIDLPKEFADLGDAKIYAKYEHLNPGGSIKDDDIIKTANDLNLIMVFTRERHFYH